MRHAHFMMSLFLQATQKFKIFMTKIENKHRRSVLIMGIMLILRILGCGTVNMMGKIWLLWLGQLLYPEYTEYDLQEEVTEYYKLFYGCDLTEEMYQNLLTNAIPE